MPENPYEIPQSSSTLSPPPLPSMDASPWNAWWTLLWAFLLFLVWQICMTIGLGISLAFNGETTSQPEADLLLEALEAHATDGDIIGMITFATIFVICPACWFIGKLRPGWSGWEYLGNARTKWWHWPISGVAIVVCSIIFSIIGPSLGIDGPDESMAAMGQSTQYPILLFLGVAIGAPLIEEFIFRGVLWRGWRLSRLGLIGTLTLTSFLWAILHVQYPGIIIAYIFCLGLVLGLARQLTGSLWIPVWMHAVNNGLATLSMLSL